MTDDTVRPGQCYIDHAGHGPYRVMGVFATLARPPFDEKIVVPLSEFTGYLTRAGETFPTRRFTRIEKENP